MACLRTGLGSHPGRCSGETQRANGPFKSSRSPVADDGDVRASRHPETIHRPESNSEAATLTMLSPLSREASVEMLFTTATHCEKSPVPQPWLLAKALRPATPARIYARAATIQGVERGNRRDECRSGEVVEAHHQPRLVVIQQTLEDRPGDDAGRSKQRMTRPTAAPKPVNCSTNQSKAMMVNWSPRYEMLSPSRSRWNAGWRNGAPTAAVRAMSR
jgi:hypothetical protein